MISVQKTKVQAELPAKRTTAILAGLQLMLLLAAVDQTIISTAMPKIVAQLGGFDRYAWATTAYLLTSTVSIPVFGRLSDLYGRKNFLLAGVLLFIVASSLCALAGLNPAGNFAQLDSMNQFIAARAVQGLGAGIMLGLCFSVVGDLFPAAERGKYQGHFAAVFALASVVGPTLGGWVSDHYSWRWLFFSNIPIGLAAILVFNSAFPSDKKSPANNDFDFGGIGLFICAFGPLLVALSLAPKLGWLNPVVVTVFGAGVAVLVWFLLYESRRTDPFIKIPLLCRPVVALSCISVFVTGIGMFGSVMLLPIFFQSVLGFSAAKSGALLSPLIIIVAASSIVGGYWMSKKKTYKPICLTGMFCIAAGNLLLSRIGADTDLIYIFANMFVVGIGLGLLLPIYTIVIQNAVPEEDIGSVTGFSQFFRSVGGTAGVAVFGTLMLSLYEWGLQKSTLPAVSDAAIRLIHNPLEPGKLRHSLEQIVPSASQLADLFHVVKESLIGSVDIIFLAYGLVAAVTMAANFCLAELPLRQSSK